MTTQEPAPLNVIVTQVENGYVVYEAEYYRIGPHVIRRAGDESGDLRRQWVAADISALAGLIKSLAFKARATHFESNQQEAL